MPRESFGTVVKRRGYGLLFIVVVVGLVSLSIAIYNKVFTPTTDITIAFDHTGNELLVDSDVKERGIIVGSVKSVDSQGYNGALVHIALAPDRVKDIPYNVTAQILPKTLFGEQYVDLVIPSGEDNLDHPTRAIAAGATIEQDRTKGALETEKVLADIYPLLTAVQPAQLNSTLTALADALHGRGNELGQTLVNLDKYLKIMNPHTKQFVDDLHQLGEVALEYNGIAPDLLGSLQNLETSARTVVEKQAGLNSLLVDGSDTSQVLQGFLADNQQRLIDITGQTNKIYSLLNEYSPEFTCLFQGVNKLDELATNAIYDNRIHLSITVDQQNLGPYIPGNEPKIVTGYGPNCFGLPNPPKPFLIPAKYQTLCDGAPLTKAAVSPSCPAATQTQKAGLGALTLPSIPGLPSGLSGLTGSSYANKAVNSPEENAYINSIIGPAMHTSPAKVSGAATLLAGPLLRGQQVVVK